MSYISYRPLHVEDFSLKHILLFETCFCIYTGFCIYTEIAQLFGRLKITDGRLSSLHKYSTFLNVIYFNSKTLRQSKRLPYSMAKRNLAIEF